VKIPQDVICSVRPETMMIDKEKSDWDICLQGKIKQTSYLGEMTKFYIETKEIDKTYNCFISIF